MLLLQLDRRVPLVLRARLVALQSFPFEPFAVVLLELFGRPGSCRAQALCCCSVLWDCSAGLSTHSASANRFHASVLAYCRLIAALLAGQTNRGTYLHNAVSPALAMTCRQDRIGAVQAKDGSAMLFCLSQSLLSLPDNSHRR